MARTTTGHEIRASVVVKKLPPRTIFGFHTEMLNTEVDGHKVRFCQQIGGRCFWFCVDADVYEVSTQDLCNAIASVAMAQHGEEIET